MGTFRTSLHSLQPVLLVAAVVFIVKAIFLLSTSVNGLALTTWIIDDAFIEIAVARNIALGHGFSYDFIHATTGSPFLWTYLISIHFFVFSKMLAIKMAFVSSALCAALATIVTYLLALKVTANKTAAWIAFILATFSANAFFQAMNGMDTAIFTLLLMLSVATYFGVGIKEEWPAFVRGMIPGIFAGLSTMVRGDGIFIVGTLLLLQLWQLNHSRKRKDADLLAGLATFAILGFAILTLWQLARTGSPFPANQVGRRNIALALHNFSFAHFSLPQYLNIVAWNVFQLEHIVTIASGTAIFCLIALLFGFADGKTRRLAAITTIYAGTFFFTLVTYQWYFPDFHGLRYVNPSMHLFFIFAAWLLVNIPWGKMKKWGLSLATTLMLVLAGYAFYDQCIHMPYAPSMSLIGRPTAAQVEFTLGPLFWMKNNLPANTIIGVRDHGRVAIFTELPIQDIAGNIDPMLPKLVSADPTGKQLAAYLQSRNVSYLLLPPLSVRPDTLYKEIYKVFSLEVVPETARPGGALYKIRWDLMK